MKKFALLLSAFIVLISSASTGAVAYGGIGGQPANPRPDNPRSGSIFIHTLELKQSVNDGVKIFNNSDEQRTIAVNAVDAVLANDGAFACAQLLESQRNVGSWVQLPKTSVTVEANSSVVVPFSITVPERANVGEHNGCITIQDMQVSEPLNGNSGVMIGFRSAIRLVVTVPGEIIKDLDFDDLTTQGPADGKYTIHPKATNNGNVSLDTALTVRLRSLFGQVAASNDATYPILPNSTASWNFELDRPFWGGFYWAEVDATYDGSDSSTLGEAGNDKTTISERSKLFFAAPEPLAAFIMLGALLLTMGLLIWLFLYRRKNRHIRKLRKHKRS